MIDQSARLPNQLLSAASRQSLWTHLPQIVPEEPHPDLKTEIDELIARSEFLRQAAAALQARLGELCRQLRDSREFHREMMERCRWNRLGPSDPVTIRRPRDPNPLTPLRFEGRF